MTGFTSEGDGGLILTGGRDAGLSVLMWRRPRINQPATMAVVLRTRATGNQLRQRMERTLNHLTEIDRFVVIIA